MIKKKLIRIVTDPISFKKLLTGQLVFMREYYDVIAVSSAGENLLEIGEKQEVRTFTTFLTRKITPWLDLKAIYYLYRFFKSESPFIVHTHTPKAGFVGMTASFLACVPCKLHTVAGLPLMESYGIKRKILEIVEKLTYMLADKVYPNSFGLKEFIIKNKFCKKDKLTVIGYGSSNGIDTNYFSMNNDIVKRAEKLKIELGIKDHDFVFCFIGRVVKDKGINELLYSFNEINKNNKNTKLLLIGPFEEDLDPISNTSKEILNSNKNIIHCGWQDDVRQYLAASNALVFPSYREGFPNVPMQAGAMGLPCIVSNINGCNEIIENGKNGLIVEPKNKNELIVAMLKLMNDNDLRLYLASNARDLISSRYEQTYVWNEILKEYQKLEIEYLK